MTNSKLAIVLEGGLVQTIVTEDESLIGMAIDVIDYDTDGADDDEISPVQQSDGSYANAILNTFTVEKATIVFPNLNDQES